MISFLSIAQKWLYTAWFNFVVIYRRTMLGPVWLLVSPALFIAFLGMLFTRVNASTTTQFIPFMAVGFITWTLMSGFLNNSTTVFQRHHIQIMQGGWLLADIIMVDVITTILHFLHQVVIIAIVMLIFKVPLTSYTLVSLVGLALIVLNGIWLTVLFGIIGARYRDLAQIVMSIMSIAFLATPIIWIPAGPGRGSILDAYLLYNPFYYFLELVRAPILGTPIAPFSWIVVLTITVAGIALAYLFYKRYARLVPLWV